LALPVHLSLTTAHDRPRQSTDLALLDTQPRRRASRIPTSYPSDDRLSQRYSHQLCDYPRTQVESRKQYPGSKSSWAAIGARGTNRSMPRRPRSATGYIPVGALDLFGDENIDCAQRFIYAVVSFRNGGQPESVRRDIFLAWTGSSLVAVYGGCRDFDDGWRRIPKRLSDTPRVIPPRLNYCFHRLFAWAPSIFFIGGELFDRDPGFFRRASARCKLPF
jgi:hypothetical protein